MAHSLRIRRSRRIQPVAWLPTTGSVSIIATVAVTQQTTAPPAVRASAFSVGKALDAMWQTCVNSSPRTALAAAHGLLGAL